ncbi:hypothetical protein [Nocardiopsis baichengensis]|uniref:hypothetical protein n=1 Tax=Nocardiopsis baichengensis TaxID=280240 RepID=UPI00034506B5|nr:hypothetical protein [Nocardiopsis baichengensis]
MERLPDSQQESESVSTTGGADEKILDRNEDIVVGSARPDALREVTAALERQGWDIHESDAGYVVAEHGSRFMFGLTGER